MSERLYYLDSYTAHFSAAVVEHAEHEGHPAVVLSESYFYPTGGGQPHDTGTLNGHPVLEVVTRPSDNAVLHVLADSLTARQVEGVINWARRFDFMQQHTGQHILSRAFEILFDADTVGFHLTEDGLTIDLNKALTEADLEAAEEEANRIVYANLPVKAWFPGEEELAGLPLRKLSEKVSGAVRVVGVGDFDLCACGGTHVAQTGEIGLIKLIRAEKHKNGLRLEFKCGRRALRDYRQKNALLMGMAAEMTLSYTDIPATLERLREDNKTLSKEVKAARTQLLGYEADALWQAAQTPDSARTFISAVWEGREVAELQGVMSVLMRQPNTVALLALAGDSAHVIFGATEDTGLDVVPAFKAALAQLGSSKGGGRPTLAQGGGFPANRPAIETALAEALNSLQLSE